MDWNSARRALRIEIYRIFAYPHFSNSFEILQEQNFSVYSSFKSFYPFFREKRRVVIYQFRNVPYFFFHFRILFLKLMIELKKFIGKTCRSWRALFRDIIYFSIWHTFNWHFTLPLVSIFQTAKINMKKKTLKSNFNCLLSI